MKAFDHFNTAGAPCPVCGTREDKPAVLVGKDGTAKDGIEEALQIHLDCIELRYRFDFGNSVLYQIIRTRQIKETA